MSSAISTQKAVAAVYGGQAICSESKPFVILLQYFKEIQLQLDDKMWMLLDPQHHQQTAIRILKIWEPTVSTIRQAQQRKITAAVGCTLLQFQGSTKSS